MMRSAGTKLDIVLSTVMLAWIAAPLVRDGQRNLVEALPFLAVSLAGVILAAMFFAGVREAPAAGTA